MLSIIVPVFNVAQYLRHCLQSLTEQGLEDYEVILVNDASTDNSMGICSEWCLDHPAFQLICHDQNKGLSEARNTGICAAKGDWITFVDSDDFLAPNTLAQVMNHADTETDVIEYPVMERHLSEHPHLLTFSDSNHSVNRKSDATSRSIDFKQWLSEGGHKHCYAWNKIYRATLWQDVRFPKGRYYEDMLTIPLILKKARSIKQCNDGVYYYCDRRGSICNTPSDRVLTAYIEAYAHLLSMPESEGNYDLYLRAYNAELNYKKVMGRKANIIKLKKIPFGFAFSKGLTFHDRLKILWLATTIHG